MNINQIRQKFLDFFKKKGHKIVPSSSLIPTDPSVLLTAAGMQQFKEYFTSEKDALKDFGSKRIVSVQKCFRTSDIEEVGDKSHLTFFEMLGNFSFGDYFKKEAIEFAHEFLIENCKLKIENLWITYFKGDPSASSGQVVPEDSQTREFWLKLGIPKGRIHGFGREDNFWGPTGQEGPCGPTSEIHYDLAGIPCKKGKNCIPNCDCGRFTELWNLVFNQYYQDQGKKLTPLVQAGVDTGLGLERLAMLIQQKKLVFDTDIFQPIMANLPHKEKACRVIADHIRGTCFLIADGILPSNIEQGYILRRVLRRAIRYGKLLNQKEGFLIELAKIVISTYQEYYPELRAKQADILTVIQKEDEKFSKTLEKGLKEFNKVASNAKKEISGKDAFHLYDTYGFPIELTRELALELRLKVDEIGFKEAFKIHQEVSRAAVGKKFGGHGIKGTGEVVAETKEEKQKIIRLHTATHLLHQALRDVLGDHVKQMGSDINPERLRFDFSHPEKLTPEEIKKVQDFVNQKIRQDLEVKMEEMSPEEAIKSGALAFFQELYSRFVKVYSIGDYSKEICAGPHVERTGELGTFKIIKEQSSSAGVRRIKATLVKS